MKKNLLLFLAVLFISSGYAQINRKAVVFLKSGGVIKGKLLINDEERVKINSSGNEWVFKNSEVDSVVFAGKVSREKGITQNYFFDTALGVLVGNSGNSQNAPFSFSSSFNYRLVDKLYVGAGLGTEFLDETYMPAFAQIRYKLRDTRFTPFFNLQMGYQVPLEKESRKNFNVYYVDYSSLYRPGYQQNQKLVTHGGYMINPSIGFQSLTSNNLGWFFSFGYRYHQLNYSGENKYELETNFSRLSLKIGFIFN